MKEKITFNDLSTSLKFLVVCCWIIVILMFISFIIGFINGIIGG